MTGGTFFQATPPGAFTSQRLNLGDQGPDEAYDGRLALDGSNPVAEFQDLSNHIYIREWGGVGDINSSSGWSVARIDGQGYSRLVGGPSGVWLLYQKTFSGPLFVQRIVHGAPSGAAFQVTPNTDFWHANYAITEDAAGRLTVGWFSSDHNDLYVQSSTDGRHWSAPQLIARNPGSPSDEPRLIPAEHDRVAARLEVPDRPRPGERPAAVLRGPQERRVAGRPVRQRLDIRKPVREHQQLVADRQRRRPFLVDVVPRISALGRDQPGVAGTARLPAQQHAIAQHRRRRARILGVRDLARPCRIDEHMGRGAVAERHQASRHNWRHLRQLAIPAVAGRAVGVAPERDRRCRQH
jgi:hypothetical protein